MSIQEGYQSVENYFEPINEDAKSKLLGIKRKEVEYIEEPAFEEFDVEDESAFEESNVEDEPVFEDSAFEEFVDDEPEFEADKLEE